MADSTESVRFAGLPRRIPTTPFGLVLAHGLQDGLLRTTTKKSSDAITWRLVEADLLPHEDERWTERENFINAMDDLLSHHLDELCRILVDLDVHPLQGTGQEGLVNAAVRRWDQIGLSPVLTQSMIRVGMVGSFMHFDGLLPGYMVLHLCAVGPVLRLRQRRQEEKKESQKAGSWDNSRLRDREEVAEVADLILGELDDLFEVGVDRVEESMKRARARVEGLWGRFSAGVDSFFEDPENKK